MIRRTNFGIHVLFVVLVYRLYRFGCMCRLHGMVPLPRGFLCIGLGIQSVKCVLVIRAPLVHIIITQYNTIQPNISRAHALLAYKGTQPTGPIGAPSRASPNTTQSKEHKLPRQATATASPRRTLECFRRARTPISVAGTSQARGQPSRHRSSMVLRLSIVCGARKFCRVCCSWNASRR